MELKDLVKRMRCPRCEGAQLELRRASAACSQCGASLPIDGKTIGVGAAEPVLSDEWSQMQEGSVERYQDEHYGEDETHASIFGGFVALTLKPEDHVFDVGCGLFPSLPAYARHLNCAGYVGLEPLTTRVDREYLCITGAVAEKLPLKDGSFEAVLLATSLDHIERPDEALAELKRILAPGGRLYFWVGVHEPEVQARAKTFHSIFYGSRGLMRIARIAGAYAEYGHFLWRMAKRRRALEKGIPLDHAHFRYYTRKSLMEELDANGLSVRRELIVPGTNSILVEAVPR